MSATDAELESPQRDNRSGIVLAQRYRLQRRLGVGGMGEVYEARHTEIPRRFAVKLLRSEFARDPQMRARFRSEAETAASLSSDHIVEVTDFGYAEDGSPYLVMELLEGFDLRRLLVQAGRLTVGQAVAVALETCAGLTVAHAQAVVHRDLKPENLFLARRGERPTLKLLDFGIAKLRNQSLGTAGGRLLGTPAYMPPEQVRGDAGIDGRADIYALGVILYEMLGGRVPHSGTGQHEIITRILFDKPAPLRELNHDVPAELAAIVHRALAAAAADRYQSVGELELALAPFAGEAQLPLAVANDVAGQPTLPAQSSDPDAARASSAASVPPSERSARGEWSRWPRLGRPWLLAPAALLLAAGLAGTSHFRGRDAPPYETSRAATEALIVPRRSTTSDAQVLAPAPLAPAAAAAAAVEAARPDATVGDPPEQPQRAPERPQPAPRRAAPRAATVGDAPEQPQPTRERPRPARRRATRRAAPAQPTAAAPEPAAAADDSSVIEVHRDQTPLLFKRDNPLRR